MKTLNVGLVGAGFMGKAHVVAYSNMPKFFWPAPAVPVLKTICDIDPDIARDAKDRFGFEKYCTDWQDIVNDPEIDVVSVCTPNNAHAPIAIAALKAGKHVLCEKPIASTLEDGGQRGNQHERVPVPQGSGSGSGQEIYRRGLYRADPEHPLYLSAELVRGSGLPSFLEIPEGYCRRRSPGRHRLSRN